MLFSKLHVLAELSSFVPLFIKLETAAVSTQSAVIKHTRAKLSSFNFSHLLPFWDPKSELVTADSWTIQDLRRQFCFILFYDITFYIFYFSFMTSIISFFLLAFYDSSSSFTFSCHFTLKYFWYFSPTLSHISILFPLCFLSYCSYPHCSAHRI